MKNESLKTQVDKILKRENEKIKKEFKKVLTENCKKYEEVYKKEIKTKLKIKSNFLSTVTSKIFDKKIDRLPQLNVYSKKSFIVESHFNHLTTKKYQLIFFDYVKKSYTKKKRSEMLKLFFENDLIVIKNDVFYVKYNKVSKRYVNSFLRNSYKKFTNDKKEINKNVKDYVKLKQEENSEILVPICFSVDETNRKRRINLENVNTIITNMFINDVKKMLNKK